MPGNGPLKKQKRKTFSARHENWRKCFTQSSRMFPLNDQQTLALQNRAMWECASRRGSMIALQVREVNSGLEAARQREIDVVLVR